MSIFSENILLHWKIYFSGFNYAETLNAYFCYSISNFNDDFRFEGSPRGGRDITKEGQIPTIVFYLT